MKSTNRPLVTLKLYILFRLATVLTLAICLCGCSGSGSEKTESDQANRANETEEPTSSATSAEIDEAPEASAPIELTFGEPASITVNENFSFDLTLTDISLEHNAFLTGVIKNTSSEKFTMTYNEISDPHLFNGDCEFVLVYDSQYEYELSTRYTEGYGPLIERDFTLRCDIPAEIESSEKCVAIELRDHDGNVLARCDVR